MAPATAPARPRPLTLITVVTVIMAVLVGGGLTAVPAAADPTRPPGSGAEAVTVSGFPDVPDDHVFAEPITWMASEGIANGYRNGRFGPDRPVTRQAAAAFLARFAGPEVGLDACAAAPFRDVPAGHPFCAEIAWLSAEGVVDGYDDATFGPDRPVTRQAVAAFLTRLAGPDAVLESCVAGAFVDVPAGHRFCAEISWMVTEGLATGFGDGTYRPSSVVSRQAMAAFLHRFAQRGESEPIDPEPSDTAGWRFVPETLLLQPGAVAEVQLAHFDDSGAPTDAPAPTIDDVLVSAPGVVSFEVVDGGLVRVTAGPAVGAVVAAVPVPDAALHAPLTVTVADLAPDVVALVDAAVAFPAPTATDHGPGEAPWYRSVGVGPFTWSEIGARIDLPEQGADGDVTWPGSTDAEPDLRAAYPLVLVDTPIAEGAKVIGTGGSGVMGIARDVVQRVHGGHAFSLATVEMADVFAFFDDVLVDIDYEDLLAVGVAPDFAADEDTDFGPAAGPASMPGDVSGLGASSATALQPGPGRAGAVPAADAPAPRCTSANLQGLELKTTVQMGLTPHYHAIVDVDGSRPIMQMEFGVKGRAAASLGVTAQLAVTIGVDCEIWSGPVFKVPAPLPIGAFFNGTVEQSLNFVAELKATGGPKYEGKAFCEATIEMRGGFRYNGLTETFEDRNRFERSFTCDTESKVLPLDVPGLGVPVAVEGGIGVDINSPTGVQVGGAVVERIGRLFGREGLGKAEFIESKISPRVKAVWENDATVVGAEESGSKAGIELGASIALKADPIDWLVSKFANRDPKDGLTYTIAEIDPPLVLATFYRSLNKGELAFSVDGEERTQSPLVVTDEQEVTVTAKTVASPTPWNEAPPAVHGLDAWIRFSDDGDWERFTGLTFAGSTPSLDGPEVRGRFEVTPTLCDRIDRDKPATVVLLPQTYMFGILETSGHAGRFTMRCGDPTLEFEDSTLTFSAADLRDPDGRYATLDLTLFDANSIAPSAAWSWTLESVTPDWLTITTVRGDQLLWPQGSTEHLSEVRFDVDCKDHREQMVHVVQAQVDHAALDEPLTASLLVEADCTGIYVEWADGAGEPGGAQPGPFQAPVSTSVTLVTEGREDASWTATAQSGSVSPASGQVGSDKSTITVSIDVPDDREPACEVVQPERTETVTIAVGDRGTKTVEVKFREIPEKDPADCEDGGGGGDDPADPTPPEPTPPDPPCTGSNCKPKPPCSRCRPRGGGSQRDPHLVTMDGASFSAQVLGEYTYLGPDVDHPDYDPESPGSRVDARHELTAPDSTGTIKPTSITGVSVDVAGHRIEAYTRPGLVLLVDGEERPLGSGISDRLVGDVQITAVPTPPGSYGPTRLYIEGPDIKVEAEIYIRTASTSLMNLWVWSIEGEPQRGLLGNTDGDQSNDLRSRDGTVFPLALIRQHRIDLYRLTDSWRIVDPSDSIFTRTYDGFDDVNHEVDLDAVAEWIGQAETLLARAGRVCSGVEDPRLAEMLAWELAIGTDPDELGDLICTYRVGGRVVLEDAGFGYPLAGVEVRLAGPGLVDCTTLTSSSGSFSCNLHADVSTGEPGEPAPPTVTAVAVWPGAPDQVLATGTVEFRGRAEAGQVSQGTINLVTDASAAPLIELTGSLTWGGTPHEGPFLLYLNALDAEGNTLPGSSGPISVSHGEDGTFTRRELLPRGATAVRVTYVRYGEWQPVTTVLPLEGASPYALRWDADVRTVTVSGRYLHNDEPTGPVDLPVTVHPLDGDGQRVDGASWTTRIWVGPTGGYDLELVVPGDIVGIDVDIATMGGTKTLRIDPVPPGSSEHVFDVVVTGTAVRFEVGGEWPTMQLEVTPHLWTSGPPQEWELAPTTTLFLQSDEGGYYFEGVLPVEAGAVTVRHWLNMDVTQVSHHFIEDRGGVVTVELPSVPPGGTELVLNGRAWCGGGCWWDAAFFGSATVWAVDPVTGDRTGVIASDVLLAPNPVTGDYTLFLAIPAGVGAVDVVVESHPAHGGCFTIGAYQEFSVTGLDGGSQWIWGADIHPYMCM